VNHELDSDLWLCVEGKPLLDIAYSHQILGGEGASFTEETMEERT
jgi:hypothetical protein